MPQRKGKSSAARSAQPGKYKVVMCEIQQLKISKNYVIQGWIEHEKPDGTIERLDETVQIVPLKRNALEWERVMRTYLKSKQKEHDSAEVQKNKAKSKRPSGGSGGLSVLFE